MNKDDGRNIVFDRLNGLTLKELAKKYKVGMNDLVNFLKNKQLPLKADILKELKEISRSNRNKFPKGEQNPKSKLTKKDVMDIRNSTDDIEILATRYNISSRNIYYIKEGKTWRGL